MIKGLKEKRDFFPPSRGIVGVFLTLKDWWCCGCLGLKIRVIEEIFCNHSNL